MFLITPPAEIQPATLPAHVHPDLPSARKSAGKTSRPLLCIFPTNEYQFRDALASMNTLEGAQIRSLFEVWLANPGQSGVQALADKAGVKSLPAIVVTDAKAKLVLASLSGPEVPPLDQVCGLILQRKLAVLFDPSPETIKTWAGGLDPEPFLAFGRARTEDLAAAAKEPFHPWLLGLLRGTDPNLQLWAATRLIEGNATIPADGPNVWSMFLRDCEKQLMDTVQNRSHEAPRTPSPILGQTGVIDPQAPFWPVFRSLLRSPKAPRIGTSLYALMAPVLQLEDRDWVLNAFSSKEAASTGTPWKNTAFWIGMDWLLAYGTPADWMAFQSALADADWRQAVHSVEFQIKQIPAFWNASPSVQSMFCEGETADSFWKNPDACLASWGITRENLIELSVDQIRLVKGGAYLKYPEEAKRFGFTGTLRVRTLVDVNGKVLWARPLPGYALCFFAPFGLRYAANATYEPTKVGGVKRPSQFTTTFPFKLR